jgi:aminobenzoyl-glutamate utilization protein B
VDGAFGDAQLSRQLAKDYFTNVQTRTLKFRPLMASTDQPTIWLNAETMATYRDQMRRFYYDTKRFDSYLQQLGITYPTPPLRTP